MKPHQRTEREEAQGQMRFAEFLALPVKCDLDRAARKALDRLIEFALQRSGQGRIVADFLLAWWNSKECGAFNPAKLWGLDKEIGDDVCLIFRAIASMAKYPDALGYEKQFSRLLHMWRPQLFRQEGPGELRPRIKMSV